jgi:hypothetical protein
VGSGRAAALEAVEVARDWIASGDADAMLVVAAEHVGATSRAVLAALDLNAGEQGGLALVLSVAPAGPLLSEELIEQVAGAGPTGENQGFRGLAALCRAAGLPESGAFGSVRAPE